MMKVIIADDEIKVCQLIHALVDWSEFGMEIVGTAHNGIDALELILEKKPDLVITDIRMPGYNGLEVIEKSKEVNKNIEFIIISGYKQFEYAQKAIKFGVSDYLLKPIKKIELTNTLSRIKEKYLERLSKLSLEEQLNMHNLNQTNKLRGSLYLEILFKNQEENKKLEIENINREYHFKFQNGSFQCLIMKIDCSSLEDFKSIIKLLEDKIIKIMQGFLEPYCFEVDFFGRQSMIYCILNYEEKNKGIIRKQIKLGLDELNIQKSIFDKVEFTIGIGKTVKNIEILKDSLEMAEKAVMQRLVMGAGKIIENLPTDLFVIKEEYLLDEFNKNIDGALEILDINLVLKTVDAFEFEVLKDENVLGHQIHSLIDSAFNIFLTQLRKYKLQNGDTKILYEGFNLEASLYSSKQQLFNFFNNTIENLVTAAIENKKQEDIKPIRVAKQYIKENYMNPISLEEISSIVNFNASYFSSLFKKESGENFLEYLSKIRMNKAKELLRETNLNISSICEEVDIQMLSILHKALKNIQVLSQMNFASFILRIWGTPNEK